MSRPRRATTLVPALALCLVPALAARSAVLTLEVDAEIVSMQLSGAGPIALASDPGNLLGDSVDGYGSVNAQVMITESAALVSTATTTLAIDTASVALGAVTVSSQLTLFADVAISDDDARPGRDFATGTPLLIAANPAKPLTATVIDTLVVDITDPSDPLGSITVTSTGPMTVNNTVEHPLGVDVNGNGALDSIFYGLDSIELGVEDLDFTSIAFDPVDLALLEAAFVDVFVNGIDATVPLSGEIGFSSASLVFDGMVADQAADPPFSIPLDGPVNFGPTPPLVETPEPAAGALAALALGLLATGLAARRARGGRSAR